MRVCRYLLLVSIVLIVLATSAYAAERKNYFGFKGIFVPVSATDATVKGRDFGSERGEISGGLGGFVETTVLEWLTVGGELQWIALIPQGSSLGRSFDHVNLNLSLRPLYKYENFEFYMRLSGGLSIGIPPDEDRWNTDAGLKTGYGWNLNVTPGMMIKPGEAFGVYFETGGLFMGTYHKTAIDEKVDFLTKAFVFSAGFCGLF